MKIMQQSLFLEDNCFNVVRQSNNIVEYCPFRGSVVLYNAV